MVIGNTFCPSPYGKQLKLDPHFRMKGGEVFKFAVTSVLHDVKDVMKRAGVEVKDVKMLIPHQANQRVFQVAKENWASLTSSWLWESIITVIPHLQVFPCCWMS